MEAGERIRITFTVEATVTNPGQLMELGRRAVEEAFEKEEWIENYPLDLGEAVQCCLSNALFEAFPSDGPLEIHSSGTDVIMSRRPRKAQTSG